MVKAYLEAKDIQKLEKAATNMRDKLLLRVLFHLGCRVSEALALKVGDIDFASGTVTIQHLKSRVTKSLIIIWAPKLSQHRRFRAW